MSSLNGQFRVLIFKYFKINQSFLTFFGKIPLEASQALNTCQKCGKMKNDKCPPFRLMCSVIFKSLFGIHKVWGKKTAHFLRSVAHQISILELKLIKRGPNEMS